MVKMKNILLIMFAMILLIGNVSAFEFDNMKFYDTSAKEVVIKDSLFGIPTTDVARIKLLTPLDNVVYAGKDVKVAEFKINLYEKEYSEPMKELTIKDYSKTAVTRTITYKYLTYEDVKIKVPIYGEVCNETTDPKTEETKDGIEKGLIEDKPTEKCISDVVGYEDKIENREVWKPLDITKLVNGTYTIGLFTDVKPNDYKVDWVINFFGQKVEEWATWTASLNVGLISYYNFETTTGLDVVAGVNNLSYSGSQANSTGVSGKIGNGLTCAGTDYAQKASPTIPTGDASRSYFGWIKSSDTNGCYFAYGTTGATRRVGEWKKTASTTYDFANWGDDLNGIPGITTDWEFLTFTYEAGSNLEKFYVNGVNVKNKSLGGSLATIAGEAFALCNCPRYGDYMAGFVDEFGIYNRSISADEVQQLYNSGSGMTYTTSFDSLNINSNYPPNAFNSSSNTLSFNCNATSVGSNITSFNLSVYNSSSAVYSNKTTVNNLTYLMNWTSVTLPRDGSYSWNCSASNNAGLNATSTTLNFTTDTTSPSITINFPTATTYNYNVTNITWNITHPAGALSSCWFSNNSGANNYTVTCANNISYQNSSQGSNTWKLYANDTFNNVGSATVTFIVNTASHGATVQLNSPVTNTYTPSSTQRFYWGVVPIQSNITNSTLYVYNPNGSVFFTDTTVHPISSNDTANSTALTAFMPEGILKWNVRACYWDTVSLGFNCTYSVVNNTLITDYTDPVVSIVTPTATLYNTSTIPFNYTVTDTHLNSCWYSMNGGSSNTSLTCGVNVSSLSVSQGWNTVNLYVNDSVSRNASTSITFKVDSQAPSISYGTLTPLNSTNQTLNNILVDLIVNDVSAVSLTTNLYNAAKTLVATNTTTINNLTNGFCYQEFTNQSSVCGGLSTGSYQNIPIAGTGFLNFGNLIDGDYLTSSYPYNSNPFGGQQAYFIANYSKPNNAVLGSIWQFKGGDQDNITYINLTIPSLCFNQNQISLRAEVIDNNLLEYTNLTCYNGAGYYQLFVDSNVPSTGLNHVVYEEAMLWNMSFLTNFTGLADGTYHFNATATDINGFANSTQTRTVTIDTTGPVINISSPYGLYTFPQASNFNLSIKFLATDVSGVNSCWYRTSQSPSTNVTLPNCANSSLIIPNAGTNSITIYANDSLGNLNSQTSSFDISVLQYSNYTYETSSETFALSYSFNSSILSGIQGYLVYDNTQYLATVTGTNPKVLSVTLDVPTISGSSAIKSFFWRVLTINGSNTNEFNGTVQNQTILPAFYGSCNATLTAVAVNYTIYEELTTNKLNSSLEQTVTYWLGSGSTYKTYNYQNLTDATSLYSFCIYPQNRTFGISGTTGYSKAGYDNRESFFVNNSLSNITLVVPLYLAATNATDIFTIQVIDNANNPVTGAFVYVQRWDLGTNTFPNIGSFVSNDEGKGIINLVPSQVFYRFIVVYNGQIALTTDSQKVVAGNTIVLRILTQASTNPNSNFQGVAHTLTFNNQTNTFVFTYADVTNSTSQGCLEVSELTSNSSALIYRSCLVGTSGTMGYQPTANGTYVANGIIQLNIDAGGNRNVVDTLIRTIGKANKFLVIGGSGRVAGLVLIGSLTMMGIASGILPLALVLLGIGAIVVNALGLINFQDNIWIIVSLIILLVATAMRRK